MLIFYFLYFSQDLHRVSVVLALERITGTIVCRFSKEARSDLFKLRPATKGTKLLADEDLLDQLDSSYAMMSIAAYGVKRTGRGRRAVVDVKRFKLLSRLFHIFVINARSLKKTQLQLNNSCAHLPWTSLLLQRAGSLHRMSSVFSVH